MLCPLNESFFSDDLRLFLVGILGSSISIVSDRWGQKLAKANEGQVKREKEKKRMEIEKFRGGGGGEGRLARGTAGNGKDLS